jgi:hypothetical protein
MEARAGRSLWSRRSRDETTRNAPTVDSVRLSEPRIVYSRSRASCTISRSGPRGRSRSRMNTSRGASPSSRSRESRSRSSPRESSSRCRGSSSEWSSRALVEPGPRPNVSVSSSSRSRQSSSRRYRGSSPQRGSSEMTVPDEPRVNVFLENRSGAADLPVRTRILRGDKLGTIVRGFGWAGVAPRRRITQ